MILTPEIPPRLTERDILKFFRLFRQDLLRMDTGEGEPFQALNVDGTCKLGDGGLTNYAQIATDGEITLAGTARVVKYQWYGANALAAGGANGATLGLNGNNWLVYSFADNADEYVQANIRIPTDMDLTAASYLSIAWSSPTTSATGIVDVTYLVNAENESTDQAGTSDTGNTITSSATGDGLVVSDIVTFAASSFGSTDVLIQLQIMRDGDNAADTLNDVLELHGLGLKYTANKLGEAT